MVDTNMEKQYCVYEHVFPNGKRYIGISSDTEHRWRNGAGYSKQPKMARAVAKYGWDSIQHNILLDGLTQAEACAAEMLLIQALDTIRNGYNVSIGGKTPIGTYLNPYLLAMVRGWKNKWGEPLPLAVILCDGDKKDKEASGFWNQACRDVTRKHGFYSATDRCQVDEFWYYMHEYYDLWLQMQKGEDVTDWEEVPYHIAKAQYLHAEKLG